MLAGGAATAALVVATPMLRATGSDRPTAAAPTGHGEATDPFRQPGWVSAENAREGSADWTVPDDPDAWDRIRGYAEATSIDRAGPVRLFVASEAATFDVEAFRLGWYGGVGARRIWERRDVPAVDQPDPVVDPDTNMVEARWEPSVTVDVGADWPPGYYLLRLTSADGGASFVPLVVRDDASTAGLLIQSSVTTWQAYNDWGGANHYFGREHDPDLRASVVSFDRPYGGNGTGELFGRELELVFLVEQLGLDVTYWTDIDLHQQGERARQHAAVVSLGHDEYYTTTMRAGLEAARDAGVNLAFLGANAVFRRIRLEPSPLGADRRQVNHRDAAEDPLTGVDDANVTTNFREPPAADPESSLIGNMYECNPVEADMVVVDAGAWVFEGTNVVDGEVFPGIVGNEYDRVQPEWPTPDNVQVLAHSPVTCKGQASHADMTYYSADSGAGVFATGTLWWIRDHLLVDCRDEWEDPQSWQCKVQKVTANVLSTFAEGPAGRRHPSRSNLDELGITAS